MKKEISKSLRKAIENLNKDHCIVDDLISYGNWLLQEAHKNNIALQLEGEDLLQDANVLILSGKKKVTSEQQKKLLIIIKTKMRDICFEKTHKSFTLRLTEDAIEPYESKELYEKRLMGGTVKWILENDKRFRDDEILHKIINYRIAGYKLNSAAAMTGVTAVTVANKIRKLRDALKLQFPGINS